MVGSSAVSATVPIGGSAHGLSLPSYQHSVPTVLIAWAASSSAELCGL